MFMLTIYPLDKQINYLSQKNIDNNNVNKTNVELDVNKHSTNSEKLTLSMRLTQLKNDLENISYLNENKINTFLNKHNEVLELYPINNTPATSYLKNKYHLPNQNNLSAKEWQNIMFNLSLNNNYIIQAKDYIWYAIPSKEKDKLGWLIKIDIAKQQYVVKKQELQLETVKALSNNRWKTDAVFYHEKKIQKKLLLNSNKKLSHMIKNEIVVQFKPGTPKNKITEIFNNNKINQFESLDHTYIVRCNDKTTEKLIDIFARVPEVNFVEPHFIYLTNEIKPNDVLYSEYQWNLPSIAAELGWELTKGKQNVVIAVVDTGIDTKHTEFKNRIVDGYNFINNDQNPQDDDGHGTHVAGIIAANTNNMEGVAGITWYNKIMPIKVLDQSGAGTMFDVAKGIFWATDHGAKVINLSLGNYAESDFLHEAIKYAFNKDVVLIAATGNDNTNQLGYPAAYPEVLAVSAIDQNKERATFSNYGDYVDVVAPGVDIASTYPDQQYAALSGTSMSTPHVTALAGLIRSINPKLKNTEVIEIIKNTTTDLGESGKDIYFGYGEINIKEALKQTIALAEYDTFQTWIGFIKQRLTKQ